MRDLTPAEQSIVDAAAKFGRDTIEPNAEAWDADRHVPRSYFHKAGELGLCKLIVPKTNDGLGCSVTAMARVNEILSQYCMATAFSLTVHNNVTNLVARNGTPEQVAAYLPGLMRGETIGGFLLTEPGAGSDATSISTQADKTASGWVVNGSKAWVSNGVNVDLLCTWVQTEAGTGAKGIACFLIDANTPGAIRGESYALLGSHALGTTGFDFENCAISDGALMVEPGQAFRTAMKGIDFARVCVAAMCCGLLQRALSEAIDYTAARPAFGQHVGDFQGIQWMLADAATDLEAARLLTYTAAALLDEGQDATVAAAHAKKFATRAAFNRIGECMQTMGATSLSRERPLARNLAAAKMAQFTDGAVEIQNVVITRGLTKLALQWP